MKLYKVIIISFILILAIVSVNQNLFQIPNGHSDSSTYTSSNFSNILTNPFHSIQTNCISPNCPDPTFLNPMLSIVS